MTTWFCMWVKYANSGRFNRQMTTWLCLKRMQDIHIHHFLQKQRFWKMENLAIDFDTIRCSVLIDRRKNFGSWETNIGHKHHDTPEFDVNDIYLLMANSRCWRRDLSLTSKSCHQHIWSPIWIILYDIGNIRHQNRCNRFSRKWNFCVFSIH